MLVSIVLILAVYEVPELKGANNPLYIKLLNASVVADLMDRQSPSEQVSVSNDVGTMQTSYLAISVDAEANQVRFVPDLMNEVGGNGEILSKKVPFLFPNIEMNHFVKVPVSEGAQSTIFKVKLPLLRSP